VDIDAIRSNVLLREYQKSDNNLQWIFVNYDPELGGRYFLLNYNLNSLEFLAFQSSDVVRIASAVHQRWACRNLSSAADPIKPALISMLTESDVATIAMERILSSRL